MSYLLWVQGGRSQWLGLSDYVGVVVETSSLMSTKVCFLMFSSRCLNSCHAQYHSPRIASYVLVQCTTDQDVRCAKYECVNCTDGSNMWMRGPLPDQLIISKATSSVLLCEMSLRAPDPGSLWRTSTTLCIPLTVELLIYTNCDHNSNFDTHLINISNSK